MRSYNVVVIACVRYSATYDKNVRTVIFAGLNRCETYCRPVVISIGIITSGTFQEPPKSFSNGDDYLFNLATQIPAGNAAVK